MNPTPSVITGRVRTPAGQPIAQARVYFTSGPVALPDITTLTDTTGKFSLSAPAEGDYQIGCTADGFTSATVSITVKSRQPAQLEINLTPI